MHLLKCQYRPSRHTRSCTSTLIEQRREIELLLEENPCLRHELATTMQRRYAPAARDAAKETGLPRATFPATLPYTAEQILDLDFEPGN